MFTVVVKEKEETPADSPYGFGGLSAIAFTPLTKILLGGALMVFLTMGTTIAWQTFKLQRQEIKLLEAESQQQLLQNEIDNCKDQLDGQNQLIDQIRKDAEDDISLVESINDQLLKAITIQDREVERLKDLPVPATCEESKQLLIDNLNLFRSNPE
jgi:hypothetical protein